MKQFCDDSEEHWYSLLTSRLNRIPWFLITAIISLCSLGVVLLYSAANGVFIGWASQHLLRCIAALLILTTISLTNGAIWYRLAWWLYIGGIISLILVDVIGHTSKGAERWLDLGFMRIQPSEIMKIFVILALARFFHDCLHYRLTWWLQILGALIIIAIPVALVLQQPDLGTALLILICGLSIMFLAGISWYFFMTGIVCTGATIPILWQGLKPYQKSRIMTFLNPEKDMLGEGYHIMQSKIALGSGGIYGRGFMKGTQTQLQFLPEKHTDFIFTAYAEQFGLIGGISLIIVYLFICLQMTLLSISCRYVFGYLVTMGIGINFFLYVFINIAMVMGLVPVVGVPLPFLSYGGTSILAIAIGFGIAISTSLSGEPRTGLYHPPEE